MACVILQRLSPSLTPRLAPLRPLIAANSRCLATVATSGLGKPSYRSPAKPKSQTQRPTIQRRRQFDPDDNPFFGSQIGFGAMTLADHQINVFQKEGGFDHLAGAGKPLPDRNPAPWKSREDSIMDDIAEHMCKERDGLNTEDKATFKKAAYNVVARDKARERDGK